MTVSPALFLIVFFMYLASFVFYFIHFEARKTEALQWGQQLVVMGMICHFIFLLALLKADSQKVSANLSEFIIPFIILIVSYVLEARVKARFFMLFSLPIALLIAIFAVAHSGKAPDAALARGQNWLILHLGFILTGLAGLLTAVSSAMMYLLQSAQLKSKHLGNAFFRLPSLDVLDRIHFVSLVWGIVLFSFGILSGIFWAKDLDELGRIFHDPKVILSISTAFMYLSILCLRFAEMRRGQKIAIGTIAVFILLLVTILSSHNMSAVLTRGV